MTASPPQTRISAWVIAVAMLMLVGLAGGLFFSIQTTRAHANRVNVGAREDRTIEAHAGSVGLALLASQNAERGFLIARDQASLDRYGASRRAGADEIAILDTLTQSRPGLRPVYLSATREYRAALDVLDGAVAESRQGDTAAGIALIKSQTGPRAVDAAREAITDLQSVAHARAVSAEQRINKVIGRVDRMITFLGLLFVVTIGVTLLWVYNERGALQALAVRLLDANVALDAARQRAEDADTAKSRFLALASHDMRQPLHAITLYLASLRRRVDNEQAKDIVVRMEQAANALTRMFAGLLDLARIESGVLKARPTAFKLQEAFDAVAAEIAPECASANVKLRIVGSSLEVSSDPELLESILRNLLTNALKYAPNGRVLLGCRRAGPNLRIEVRDEGPGIPEDKLIMVFGEFIRLDAAKGAVVDGLGLGLSIASRLAQLLGSSLHVESKPGKGSCFYLTVPVVAKLAPRQAEKSAARVPSLKSLRIAVKDDEPLALAAMAAVLADAGADVHAFSESARYVEAIRNGAEYDLIIGDPVLLREARLALPERDGKRPPIIVLTGATDAPTFAALDAANSEFLIKPVSEDALLAAVARVAKAKTAA